MPGPAVTPPASILIAEDERIVARDMERILTGAGYEVLGIASCAEDVRRTLTERSPDLVLLDIALTHPEEGLDLASSLAVPVLFVSGRSDLQTLERAGGLPVRGFVVKPFSAQQLLASVAMALGSAHAQSPEPLARVRDALQSIAKTLADAGMPMGGPSGGGLRLRNVPGLERLSAREREVLDALLAHRRPPQIAEDLFISPHTVRNHFKSIYAKLGVHSQAELLELLVVREEG